MPINLQELVSDFADALVHIDTSREPFRTFQTRRWALLGAPAIKTHCRSTEPTTETPRGCADEKNPRPPYPK